MFKVLTITAALAATAAVAQSPTDAPARSGPSNDPDEMVCVNESVIGSRLNRVRVCRTRAEWAAHRAETRKTVERVQLNKQTTAR
ncbi:MAG TPA: hypothetical protein VGX37_05480 [Allosphingosinicella sp.]|jgi:hypothetical protein|nr:hypothetical protein [Allosphingosinicella sp.]